MNNQHITIVSFGHFESYFLNRIAKEVSLVMNCPVKVKDGHIDLSDFFDSSRRQYDGNKILKQIDTIYSSESYRTIGLFNVDLFIPILTYIFGQAYLNGITGIVSIYRLSNERYNIAADENILLERTIKEVVHELGHTLGLIHCHTTTCVMRSSTYVEDLDQKGAGFCSNCMDLLKEKVG